MSETIAQRQYSRLADSMRKAIEQNEAEGWASPEVEQTSKLVLSALNGLALNKVPHPVMVQVLKEYMTALTKAQADAAGATNVTTKTP